MKKTVSFIIIGLIGLVLIVGIVASSMTVSITNSKTQTSNYAKDGRIKVNYDVSEENSYLYIKDTDAEIMTRSEAYHRTANNYKIRMDKAKKDYLADKTDSKLEIYNGYKVSYESALTTARNFDMSLFTGFMSAFFGTYFPVIALLAITLLINQKIDYKCCKNKKE